jgi:hypothetical protein
MIRYGGFRFRRRHRVLDRKLRVGKPEELAVVGVVHSALTVR